MTLEQLAERVEGLAVPHDLSWPGAAAELLDTVQALRDDLAELIRAITKDRK